MYGATIIAYLFVPWVLTLGHTRVYYIFPKTLSKSAFYLLIKERGGGGVKQTRFSTVKTQTKASSSSSFLLNIAVHSN